MSAIKEKIDYEQLFNVISGSGGFPGGIHPPYNKELAEDKAIERLPMPKRLVIPVTQHKGAPVKLLVKVGDEVKKGQKIGEAGGMISSPIHASSSGKVIGIAPFNHSSGGRVTSVIIETDGKDEWLPEIRQAISEAVIPSDDAEILKRVMLAGIVGLGGATFPTHVKLMLPKDKKITTVILNGAECEPYLTCDCRIMTEMPDDVVRGLLIIKRLLKVDNAYIGIEDNKQDAIKNISESIKRLADKDNIKVMPLETKYPQGGEKQLIKAVMNLDVPMGGLPMDTGVVVVNVGTASAIYRAAAMNMPLIERVVTVTGKGVNQPKNLMIPIGTLAREAVDFCGGLKEETKKVIFGGPMMGAAQGTLDVPVIKGTSGILALTLEETSINTIRPCIGCGRCVAACPMGLMPNMLSMCGEASKIERAEKYYPLNCMECGCCAFVCPSKRPIVQFIKYIKTELAKKKIKQGK